MPIPPFLRHPVDNPGCPVLGSKVQGSGDLPFHRSPLSLVESLIG